MKTMVYIFNTKVLEDKEIFEAQYKLMPEYRQKRIDSYKDANDRRMSLGAGILLAHAIKNAGFAESELKIAYKESGMPYFKNDLDFHFSLSHSNERAMCAVSDESIGCDVEFVTENANPSPAEWTKIESYAKATDMPLSQLMGNKSAFDPSYQFKQIELKDGYSYTVCTQELVTDEQIEVFTLPD